MMLGDFTRRHVVVAHLNVQEAHYTVASVETDFMSYPVMKEADPHGPHGKNTINIPAIPGSSQVVLFFPVGVPTWSFRDAS